MFYTEFAEQFIGEGQITSGFFLEKICTYFYRNRAFYVSALEQEGQNSFSEYFADVMRSLLSLYYTDVVDRDDAYEFIITFYTDALLAALKRWLREGTMPPERFCRPRAPRDEPAARPRFDPSTKKRFPQGLRGPLFFRVRLPAPGAWEPAG